MTEPRSRSRERFTGNIRVPEGLELSASQLAQLASLLLTVEQDEHAPTAVRDAAEASQRHLADSLIGLEIDELRRACVMADLGSGVGFPGVALAVARPRARIRLVESQRRKCDFLERMLAAADVTNAEVVCSRVEEWARGAEAHDAVLARALAPQPVVLEYGAPLLRQGGVLVDWRGRRNGAEEQAALRASEELGLERLEIRHVEPFPGALDRHLHVFVKRSETPPRFPRRAGIARKRPLGAGESASDRERR